MEGWKLPTDLGRFSVKPRPIRSLTVICPAVRQVHAAMSVASNQEEATLVVNGDKSCWFKAKRVRMDFPVSNQQQIELIALHTMSRNRNCSSYGSLSPEEAI